MADTTGKTPTVQEQMKTRETESQANINSVYDSGLNTQKQALLDAYNQNTAAQTQQDQNIKQNYEKANYDVGVQNARNENNLTQFADVRGVNTGLGSQHQLNLGNARARAEGALAYQQQQALAENQRQQDLATQTYQNQVQAAMADNNYKKAAALLDDYNSQSKWRDQQAQILASYGNFDPYKDLYGEDAANGMRNVWLRQNPDTAYQIGAMDPYTYHDITGRWPAGFNPYGGVGGGGWGGYYDPGTGKVKYDNHDVYHSIKGGSSVRASGGGSSGPSGHSTSSHSSSGGKSGKF